MMPYLGQPFAGEGSPEGLLETLAFIGSLRPRLLIHGHPTLTEQFTAEAIPGLQAALTQLHGQVLDGIRDGRTLPDILEQASLPAVLREHPTAVVPYLVIRDHFTERLYHQRTGYWQPDRRGLDGHRGRARRRARRWPAAGTSSSPPPLPPSSAKAITPSPCRSSSQACCATPPAAHWPGCAPPRCTASWSSTSSSTRSSSSSTPSSPAPNRPGRIAARRTLAPVTRQTGPVTTLTNRLAGPRFGLAARRQPTEGLPPASATDPPGVIGKHPAHLPGLASPPGTPSPTTTTRSQHLLPRRRTLFPHPQRQPGGRLLTARLELPDAGLHELETASDAAQPPPHACPVAVTPPGTGRPGTAQVVSAVHP